MTEAILAPTAHTHPRIQHGQPVVMRDGTNLLTDVYRPAEPQPAASILIRSPYGIRKGMYLRLGKKFSDAGYNVILQEMRCFSQDTTTRKLTQQEGQDCFDTMAWLATHDWCNGTVSLFGISIAAFSAFPAYEGTVPEGIQITGITALGGIFDLASCLYPGGALRLHWFLPWCAMMDPRIGNREQGGDDSWRNLAWSDLLGPGYRESITGLNPQPVLWGRLADSRPEQVPVSVRQRFTARHSDRAGLLISGFYDAFLDETLIAYRHFRNAAKSRVNLIIGPWDHQSLFFSLAGVPIPPGPCTESQPLDILGVATEWFGVPQAQQDTAPNHFPPVLVFLHDRQTWLAGTSFPLPGTQHTPWFLTSAGPNPDNPRAGRLAQKGAAEDGTARFVWNAENAVPTNGGALWAFGNRWATGPQPHPFFGCRDDVLTFTTEPLTTEQVVIGVATLEVWVCTAAPGGDFAVKLVEVAPTGEATLVQDGIRRTQRPNGYAPDDPFPITIEIGACAHTFAVGGRIGIEIAGGNFPKYDIHPWSHGVQTAQTVIYGPDYPSNLLLPVVDLATQTRWHDAAFFLNKTQSTGPMP